MSSPLDDIRALIDGLPGPNLVAAPAADDRLAQIAAWLAAWSGPAQPAVRRPILALYAGAPGPARLDQSEEKRAGLEAVAAGNAAVSRLAASLGAGLEAFDLAIDRPIGDVWAGSAMAERECAATMAFGMEVLAKQPDLLIVGQIGAASIGEGLYTAGEALDRLRAFCGREVAAAAGAIVAARSQAVPVLLAGDAAAAAAHVLAGAKAGAIDHCQLAGPVSPRLQAALGLAPMTDIEGAAGGLAAAALVKLAAALLER